MEVEEVEDEWDGGGEGEGEELAWNSLAVGSRFEDERCCCGRFLFFFPEIPALLRRSIIRFLFLVWLFPVDLSVVVLVLVLVLVCKFFFCSD